MRKKHAPSPLPFSLATHPRRLAPTNRVPTLLPTVAALMLVLAGCDKRPPSPTTSASADPVNTAAPSQSASTIASVSATVSAAPSGSLAASPDPSPSASGSEVAVAAPCSASVHVVPHVSPTMLNQLNQVSQMQMAGGMAPVKMIDDPLQEGIGTTPKPVPKPQVTPAALTVAGPLDKAAVQPIVAKAQPRLRACYQKGLTADPTLSGVVSFKLVIAANGDVQGVTTSSTLPSEPLVTCMKGAFTSLKFPADAGNATTTVTAPYGFHTAG